MIGSNTLRISISSIIGGRDWRPRQGRLDCCWGSTVPVAAVAVAAVAVAGGGLPGTAAGTPEDCPVSAAPFG